MSVDNASQVPDTFNRFLVGGTGDRFLVMNTAPISRGLSRSEALNLAAWLVALADMSEGHRTFNELLAAVENT